MPSLVHSSARLHANHLALTSQTSSEAGSGLVSVNLQFVTTTQKRDRVARLFYVDAPPPIWPSIVLRDELLTRQLYMISRSIQQENGLVYINAEYAGGLARRDGFVLRFTERDGQRTVSFVSEPFELERYNPVTGALQVAGGLVNTYFYVWSPIVHIFEYAEVLSVASFKPTAPPLKELFSLLEYNSRIWRRAPEISWSALNTFSYERSWFVDQISKRPLREDRRPTFITPTVKTIEHRFYLD